MAFCGVMDIFNRGDDPSKMDVDSNKKEEQCKFPLSISIEILYHALVLLSCRDREISTIDHEWYILS